MQGRLACSEYEVLGFTYFTFQWYATKPEFRACLYKMTPHFKDTFWNLSTHITQEQKKSLPKKLPVAQVTQVSDFTQESYS